MANPRGRPKKKQPPEQEVSNETQLNEQDNYIRQYAKTMQSVLGNSYLFNPVWQNEILKDKNMTPAAFTRDQVEALLANPRQNEKELRNLSQYLFNFIMQYKQMVTYYAAILSFDYYIVPMNADEEDVQSKKFMTSYKKALNWLDEFDLKLQLPDLTKAIMLEDAKFYYLRDSKNGTILQEMPQDYCLINSKNELGYQYVFNMMYFLRPSVNLDDFAPEFRQYYNDFMNNKDSGKKNPIAGVTTENKNGRYFYWQELDPTKAWTFKYDENVAGISPPFMGLFVDAVEIATYKKLLKTKTSLDVWKVIHNQIPLQNDGKGTSTKDNFAILADTAATFSAIMQAAVPQGVKVLTSPLEAKPMDFKQSETKDSIVGLGNDEFWSSSGATRIFGESNLNGAGIEASLKNDSNFVKHLYRKFERFLNFQLKQVTGKYRFKVVLEGTEFDRDERFNRALKMVSIGSPVAYAAVAMGKTVEEFNSLLLLEGMLGIKDRMIPPKSAHTTNGNDETGRPKKNVEELVDPNRQEQ